MRPIAVLVSTRIDPVSGRATRSSADAAAVAMALRLQPQPRVLASSDMSDAVARDYLALGIPTLTRLSVSPDVDGGAALAAAAAGAGLVLCGARAQSGLGSGLLPYAVAARLGHPVVADVVDVQADGEAWLLRQALPRGARRRLRLSGPAVLVLSDRAAAATRYAWDAAERGRIVAAAAVPSPAPRQAAGELAWAAEPARKQLRRLAPPVQLSGHARMARAVGTGATGAAGQVVKEGSVEDKARALFERLLQLRLLPQEPRS